MSWREFQLRITGFERSERRRYEGLRLITYQILMSGFSPPKNKNLTIEQFWPLDQKKSNISESSRNALKEAQKKALDQLKNK
jgi:dsRNA-specific ribonuclease